MLIRSAAGPLVLFLALANAAPSAQGGEPAEEFLKALRQRGYYDLALEYLERQQDSRLVDPTWKKQILYERGMTLLQHARQQRDLSAQEQKLDQARASFEAFCQQHPDHPLYLKASSQLGNILNERARLALLRAEKPGADAAHWRQQARTLFDQAYEAFRENEAVIRSKLEQMPSQLADQPDLLRLRTELRADYVQAQLVAALILYEKAQTLNSETEQYGQILTAAEQAFQSVAEKYRDRLVGMYAMLYQARCHQDLGNVKVALGLYEDLLRQPDRPDARRTLRTKALLQAIGCWIEPEVAQFAKAIEQGEAWLAKQRPAETRDPDWLGLQLWLARAYQQQAAQLEPGAARRQALQDARRHARQASRFPSEHRESAQALLAQLGQPTAEETETVRPTTFVAARDAARSVLQEHEVAALSLKLLNERLEQTQDSQAQQELRQQLATAQQQLAEKQQAALDLFQQALRLADEDTETAELNAARYYVSYLYYLREQDEQAAAIGQFLARHYPSQPESRSAAMIALASLVRLYADGQTAEGAAYRQQLQAMADLIAAQWPGQREADDALNTLVGIALRQDQLEEAERYLEKIAETSPQRATAELKIGQAFWSRYLQEVASAESSPNTAADPEPFKQRAVRLLEQGLQRSAQTAADEWQVRAALSLAQIYVDQGQPEQALTLLEDARIGPKHLADQQHPLVRAAGFAERAFTLAIQAYIASLPRSDQPAAVIDKALATLDALQRYLQQSPEGQQRLAATYVMLARDVQQQITTAPTEARKALSQGFEQFLDRATASSQDPSVLNWAAQSYLDLGSTISTGNGRGAALADGYYQKAVQIYQQLLRTVEQQEADPRQLTVARFRLARALREKGDFDQALDALAVILQDRPAQVDVQLEAARTLQAWGDRGNADAYLKAMRGDRPNEKGQPLIWGYARLAKIVADKPAFYEMFHAARIGLSESRYEYSLQQSQEDRLQGLRRARQEIIVTQQLYPELGNDQLRQQYDQLLRKIQQALGERRTGLPKVDAG